MSGSTRDLRRFEEEREVVYTAHLPAPVASATMQESGVPYQRVAGSTSPISVLRLVVKVSAKIRHAIVTIALIYGIRECVDSVRLWNQLQWTHIRGYVVQSDSHGEQLSVVRDIVRFYVSMPILGMRARKVQEARVFDQKRVRVVSIEHLLELSVQVIYGPTSYGVDRHMHVHSLFVLHVDVSELERLSFHSVHHERLECSEGICMHRLFYREEALSVQFLRHDVVA